MTPAVQVPGQQREGEERRSEALPEEEERRSEAPPGEEERATPPGEEERATPPEVGLVMKREKEWEAQPWGRWEVAEPWQRWEVAQEGWGQRVEAHRSGRVEGLTTEGPVTSREREQAQAQEQAQVQPARRLGSSSWQARQAATTQQRKKRPLWAPCCWTGESVRLPRQGQGCLRRWLRGRPGWASTIRRRQTAAARARAR